MNSSGFSIIELVATTAVIAILATIVVFQAQRVSPTKAVDQARAMLTSELTLVRTYNGSGKVCCGGITPAYGIYAELDGSPDDTFIVYADVNNDHQFTSGDEILHTVVLKQNVDVVSCTVGATIITSATPPPNNHCDLVLSYPSGAFGYYFNGASITLDNAVYSVQSSEDPAAQQSIQLYAGSYVIETL